MRGEPETSGEFEVAPVTRAVVIAEELDAALAQMIERAGPHANERVRRIRALALGLLDELRDMRPLEVATRIPWTGTDEEPLR